MRVGFFCFCMWVVMVISQRAHQLSPWGCWCQSATNNLGRGFWGYQGLPGGPLESLILQSRDAVTLWVMLESVRCWLGWQLIVFGNWFSQGVCEVCVSGLVLFLFFAWQGKNTKSRGWSLLAFSTRDSAGKKRLWFTARILSGYSTIKLCKSFGLKNKGKMLVF